MGRTKKVTHSLVSHFLFFPHYIGVLLIIISCNSIEDFFQSLLNKGTNRSLTTTLYMNNITNLLHQLTCSFPRVFFVILAMPIVEYCTQIFCFYLQDVLAIWARDLTQATCVKVNHKFRIIAYGCTQ